MLLLNFKGKYGIYSIWIPLDFLREIICNEVDAIRKKDGILKVSCT